MILDEDGEVRKGYPGKYLTLDSGLLAEIYSKGLGQIL